MRWLSVACVCVVVVHLASSYPLQDSSSLSKQETLSSVEATLGHPTSEHSERDKRTIGVLRRIFPELSKSSSRRRREAEEPLEAAESEKKEVRVVPDGNDLKAASTGDAEDAEEAESSNEEITDDAESAASGEQGTRNKRLGVLGNLFGGGSGGGSGGSGGSGGGSGNFLFDIIRLVAGSGATEQQDESANAPVAPATGDQAAAAAPTDDGYQAGIPGPITRLFVIANRGIANLIQDLILRLAQTSERIVNFKARLITAII